MNRKTRFFMLASALTLAIGLCTGLLAYYGGLPTLASSREVGPAELKYVPADAAIVAYANVREVMASEFRQQLKQLVPEHDKHGQDEFQRETGINVEDDIDSVVACLSPRDEAPAGFVMLRGRFDAARLEAKAREHKGVQVETFQGVRLLRFSHVGGDHGKTVALAFVEPGLLMFGEEPALKRALAKSVASVTDNAEMMGMIAEIEGNANLWAVGKVEALAKNAKLPEQIAAQIPSVTYFQASTRVNGGLSGTLRAEARDDEAAKNLREVVQGFIALAKLQASSKPEMQSLFQSLQLSGSGKTVALSFEVPNDLINAMAPKAKPPVH
jgi:hypothetical protein